MEKLARNGLMSGLIQKVQVDIDWEKGTQISILANKIATQVRSPKELSIHYIYFLFSRLLCSYYIADLIKKLEMCFMVVSVILKIEFGHTQISVLKIGIPMSETACINPLQNSSNKNQYTFAKQIFSMFSMMVSFYTPWKHQKTNTGEYNRNIGHDWVNVLMQTFLFLFIYLFLRVWLPPFRIHIFPNTSMWERHVGVLIEPCSVVQLPFRTKSDCEIGKVCNNTNKTIKTRRTEEL